jgi:hypothetical protein
MHAAFKFMRASRFEEPEKAVQHGSFAIDVDASPIQTKNTICRLTAVVQQSAGTMQSKIKL